MTRNKHNLPFPVRLSMETQRAQFHVYWSPLQCQCTRFTLGHRRRDEIVYSLGLSYIQSLIHSPIHLFTRLLSHPLVHSLIDLSMYPFILQILPRYASPSGLWYRNSSFQRGGPGSSPNRGVPGVHQPPKGVGRRPEKGRHHGGGGREWSSPKPWCMRKEVWWEAGQGTLTPGSREFGGLKP